MTSLEEPLDVLDDVADTDAEADADTETDTAADSVLRCGACAHDLVDHDAIEKRYCDATQAKALPRGCICR